jgi:DNA-directed RNA polymerase subunit H (RpoH/RPB5)
MIVYFIYIKLNYHNYDICCFYIDMDNQKHIETLAKKNILTMLEDRKYTFSKELFNQIDNESIVIDGIKDNKGLSVFVVMGRADDKSMAHFLVENMKNNVNFPQSGSDVEKIQALKNCRIILLIEGSFYDFPKSNALRDIENLEIFGLKESMVNITKHKYQPKFRFLSDDEITELIKKVGNGVTSNSVRQTLPFICIDDPINRYYGGKPPSKTYRGDVYEIVRNGTSISYRAVSSTTMNIVHEKKR